MNSAEIVPFKDKVSNVMKALEKRKKQLAVALPKHVTVDRMLAVVTRSIQKNPKLLNCTEKSLLGAVMQSAQLGLECDGVTGEAYLIPFKSEVQLIPGYPGLLKLVRNTGQLSSIHTGVVYEKDVFEFEYGLEPKLRHIPSSDPEPGKIIAFWAAAKLKDGSVQFEVMWKWQVDQVRDRSASYRAAKQYDKSTPWETDYPEMGRKTPLRRLCKMLPKSTELARALRLDEQADAGEEQDFDFIDVEYSEGETEAPASKLDAIVDAAKTETETPPAQEEKPKGKPRKPASKPLENPNYAEGADEPPWFGE